MASPVEAAADPFEGLPFRALADRMGAAMSPVVQAVPPLPPSSHSTHTYTPRSQGMFLPCRATFLSVLSRTNRLRSSGLVVVDGCMQLLTTHLLLGESYLTIVTGPSTSNVHPHVEEPDGGQPFSRPFRVYADHLHHFLMTGLPTKHIRGPGAVVTGS